MLSQDFRGDTCAKAESDLIYIKGTAHQIKDKNCSIDTLVTTQMRSRCCLRSAYRKDATVDQCVDRARSVYYG
jgi:hypothetical protein